MAMAKIKAGDTIVVLSGKDKGKRGEVTRVLPKQNKLFATDINMTVRHLKPSQTNPQGGREEIEAALHISKVALCDPKTDEPTRVRFEMRDGKKCRVAVKSGEVIDG